MRRTKIEWCDYTINPVKGLCPMHCKTPDGYEYCYAAGERGLYRRFKWNPEIRFERVRGSIPPGSRVFVGSTMELFGPWVKAEWLREIFGIVGVHPELTFIFLTKQPQNLAAWSPFPSNVWVGVSAVDTYSFDVGLFYLGKVDATVKFMSFEPLLERIKSVSAIQYNHVDQVIIGQRTPVSARTAPKIEWLIDIVRAADEARVPVFLKENVRKLLAHQHGIKEPFWRNGKLRQEFPDEKG